MTQPSSLPTLSRALASHFDYGARSRGQTYFVQGRVQLRDGSPEHANASVRGTYRYQVRLGVVDRNLSADCDCPLEIPCKHIWATLLSAERHGYLTKLQRELSTNLRVDRAAPRAISQAPAPTPLPAPRPRAPLAVVPPPPPPKAEWEIFLESVPAASRPPTTSWRTRELAYAVDTGSRSGRAELVLRLHERRAVDKKGAMGPWRRLDTVPTDTAGNAAASVLSIVRGIQRTPSYSQYGYYSPSAADASLAITGEACGVLLPRLAAAGMLVRLDPETGESVPLAWDDGPPWQATLGVHEAGRAYELRLLLRREPGDPGAPTETLDLASVVTYSADAIVLRDRVARFSCLSTKWMDALVESGGVPLPARDVERFVQSYYAVPRGAELELPEAYALARVALPPRPRAHLGAPRAGEDIPVEVAFQYDDVVVARQDPQVVLVDFPRRRRIARDRSAEEAASRRLVELGVRRPRWDRDAPRWDRDDAPKPALTLKPALAPKVIRTLLAEGWHVEATGKLYRSATSFQTSLSSGIDWFELDATASYDGLSMPLPSLLAAVRRGEATVTLDDGTLGLVPEEWLARWRLLGEVGEVEGDRLRFARTQVGLLDALLEAEPDVSYDAAFTKLRAELRTSTPAPLSEHKRFRGRLRDYQRAGLGWMDLLARSGFGGCLADDMGLGKTVQVLAWLQRRKRSRQASGPSLVVAPRSLIFNWKDEAGRFSPDLSILDHTGADRLAPGPHMAGHDVVLTTYGTLRRDALALSEIAFDYAVLDEAQAIKNASSASFKAARALRARHRLALTGTPIENHVGELFTIFDFLNPSMLGRAHKTFPKRQLEPATLTLVGRALRPFILRRTKQEVVKELPAKTEKTLYCELGADERRLYDELASHYRDSLLGRIAKTGMKRAAFQVLEALLRLRQAACHPGLVDKMRASASSAKIDTLLAELASVVAEGHKALVFSQFTSLLAIVRNRLTKEGIAFEYLDGQTRDRAAGVARFQEDESCPVFLISLKAGGLGLNLTAAEYVFILDPWWNPAVEAQAVDRAHRIGQLRPVFAYRIIARGTVEEKVAELQRTKAAMAQAILTSGEDAQASGSVLADLSIEELTSLLS